MEKTKIATALSIAAGESANTIDFDLARCRKFAVLIVPSATHVYLANVSWSRDVTGNTNLVQDALIASASQLNKISALIDAKSDTGTVRITNSDAAAKTYDVYLYRQP